MSKANEYIKKKNIERQIKPRMSATPNNLNDAIVVLGMLISRRRYMKIDPLNRGYDESIELIENIDCRIRDTRSEVLELFRELLDANINDSDFKIVIEKRVPNVYP